VSAPELHRLLTLEALGPQRFRSLASQANRSGVVFGGQLLAQMLRAAESDVGGGRAPNAMQAAFLRPARLDAPLDYLVEPVFDGRSQSVRLVRALQHDQLIATATVSCGVALDGLAAGGRWRAEPLPPEQLESIEEAGRRLQARLSPHGRTRLTTLPQVEIRPLDAEDYFLVRPGPPSMRMWIRGLQPPPQAAAGCASVLAFVADYLASTAALLELVEQLPARPLRIVSMNHSMWFHAEGDPADWLLLERDSHWSGAGRTLGSGRIYRRDGVLLASMMQETLLG